MHCPYSSIGSHRFVLEMALSFSWHLTPTHPQSATRLSAFPVLLHFSKIVFYGKGVPNNKPFYW
jgi:hypothetical protein